MPWPRHKNPTVEIALAPYNFVPLPEKVITLPFDSLPDQGVYHPDRYTGSIDCLLTTESPAYVRCPLTPEEFQRQDTKEDADAPFRQQVKNKANFFATDPAQTPRIPGSSLRGMFRSLVEIVTYSKIDYVGDQQLVYRAVGDTTSHGEEYRKRIMRDDGNRRYTPLVQAGYIEKNDHGDWQIRPAQNIDGTTFARIRADRIPARLPRVNGCKNAARIYIQPGPYQYQEVRGGFIKVKGAKVLRASDQPGPGLIEGTLARSGPMASKRTEAVVFPHDLAAQPIPIPDNLVQAYQEQVSQEQKELLGRQEGVLYQGQPVFYLMEGRELVFFGHTMMMRLPYQQSPLDFVPFELRDRSPQSEPGKHPASRGNRLDMTEAIFGYTRERGEGKERAYAGRVFIGDAVLEEGQQDIWLKPGGVVIPKILGGPKATTFQHYLVQRVPDPQPVGRTKDGRPKFIKRLADYASSPVKTTVLRGHKLYWHKGNVPLRDIAETPDKMQEIGERDTQHTQFQPVKAGVRFRFCIRFENLSAQELGALLWVLTLPGQPGKTYRHSVGMGKPYGMGAIKLDPTLSIDNRQARYTSLFDSQGTGWEIAARVADHEIGPIVKAFDHFMRQQIGEEHQPALAAVERISMLLKILEWPGPAPERTRYLEIEREHPTARRGKINEYKNRPVLPDPLHVEDTAPSEGQSAWSPTTASRAERSVREQPSHPTSTSTRTTSASPASHPATAPTEAEATVQPTPTESELSRPASAAEVQRGMYLEGRVLRVEGGRVVVDLGFGDEATLQKDRVVPPPRDLYDLEERFPRGKKIRVWVEGRNKKGRIQLTMKRR